MDNNVSESLKQLANKEKEMPKTIEQLTIEEKEYLNNLSKLVFGVKSKWQKLVREGQIEPVIEEVTEYVPSEKEGEEGITRQVTIQAKDPKTQSNLFRLHRYTVDEVKKFMLDRKDQLDKLMEEIRRQQKAKEEEEIALKLNKELQGSAI